MKDLKFCSQPLQKFVSLAARATASRRDIIYSSALHLSSSQFKVTIPQQQ
jgi:hypothetical protein